jgi:ribulose-5-phosphate 4-epimerase/fuculose-1-phosphate aldolase
MKKKHQELRTKICNAAKEIYQRGLVNLGEGNISIRVPNEESMIITPTRNNYRNPQPNEQVHLSFEGKTLDDNDNPSSEYPMHSEIYINRPRVNAIIHTHAPFTSAISIQRKAIPIIFEEMILFLGGEISIASFAPTGSKQLGINVLAALGKQNATLLANHGFIVVGRTIDHCVLAAQLVEKMAKLLILTQQETVHTLNSKDYPVLLQRFRNEFATY